MTDIPDIGTDRLKAGGDDFYESLMKAHDGLSFEESAALNTRLILLMANQIADLETLTAILAAASKRVASSEHKPTA